MTSFITHEQAWKASTLGSSSGPAPIKTVAQSTSILSPGARASGQGGRAGGTGRARRRGGVWGGRTGELGRWIGGCRRSAPLTNHHCCWLCAPADEVYALCATTAKQKDEAPLPKLVPLGILAGEELRVLRGAAHSWVWVLKLHTAGGGQLGGACTVAGRPGGGGISTTPRTPARPCQA